MADTKISALPASTTPLAGTEVLPIVQSGTTKKTSIESVLTSVQPSGTANGVAYLNGSKVLTSGSALTFDGNTFTSTGAQGILSTVGGNTARMIATAGGTFFGSTTAADVVFQQNSTEGMRLTSTGLGIGTSSPGYKLDVSVGTNTIAQQWQGAGTNFTLRLKSGNGATPSSSMYRLYMDYLNGTATNSYIDFYRGSGGADGYLVFGASGADKMTLDSSGNLGLGVTPSAWGSSERALQIGNTISLTRGGSSEAVLAYNAFVNSGGSYIYNITTNASRYEQLAGQHKWYTAPSGTAGNAISFTQAMTLDASGNLGVGNTSPAAKVDVVGSVRVSSGSSFYWGDATSQITATSGGAMRFLVGDASERARIDSSGNFLIGRTFTYLNERLGVTFDAGNTGYTSAVAATTSQSHIAFYNGAVVGSITTSGSATSYNVTSDQRLKENIQDAAPASALIDALQVRQYDWKADGNHQRYGFVAQELLTVAPEAVHQPADPKEMMAVDYSKLVPMLVKEIQSLRQRLAAAGI
jgi:hypothetical protein